MNPKIIAARWALGQLPSEQLPRIALQWLEAGWDSPTLRILAGETNPIMSEVGPMFNDVLEELNISLPTSTEAVARLVSEVAQQIVDGAVTPYDGASQIYDLHISYAGVSGVDFSCAIGYLAIQYEDFLEFQNRVYYGEEHCQRVREELEAQMQVEVHKLIVSTQRALE